MWLKLLIYLFVFSNLHFGYDLTQAGILKPFCGIDESVFEHLKMAFWAYSIASIAEYGLFKPKGLPRNFFYSRLLSTILVPWTIVLLWYLAPATVGKMQLQAVELTWAIAVSAGSGFIGIYIERNIQETRLENATRAILITLYLISAFLFIRFTYSKPWIDLFINPETIM